MWFFNLFITQVEEAILGIAKIDLNKWKNQHFIKWLRTKVINIHLPQMFNMNCNVVLIFVGWVWRSILPSIVPRIDSRSSCKDQHITNVFHMSFSFLSYKYGRRRATSNYGICLKDETCLYGILQEIIEV